MKTQPVSQTTSKKGGKWLWNSKAFLQDLLFFANVIFSHSSTQSLMYWRGLGPHFFLELLIYLFIKVRILRKNVSFYYVNFGIQIFFPQNSDFNPDLNIKKDPNYFPHLITQTPRTQVFENNDGCTKTFLLIIWQILLIFSNQQGKSTLFKNILIITTGGYFTKTIFSYWSCPLLKPCFGYQKCTLANVCILQVLRLLTFCAALEGPLFLLPLGRPLGRLGTGSPLGSWKGGGHDIGGGQETKLWTPPPPIWSLLYGSRPREEQSVCVSVCGTLCLLMCGHRGNEWEGFGIHSNFPLFNFTLKLHNFPSAFL